MSKQDWRELEAYRALGKPDELCKKQGWISVKDRLPEATKRCLVVRYDAVSKTLFTDILWFEQGQWWNRLHSGDYSVTHWMPLPEPPKEGE